MKIDISVLRYGLYMEINIPPATQNFLSGFQTRYTKKISPSKTNDTI